VHDQRESSKGRKIEKEGERGPIRRSAADVPPLRFFLGYGYFLSFVGTVLLGLAAGYSWDKSRPHAP
jgi:hypothetical protein